jgi:hypothetical protein
MVSLKFQRIGEFFRRSGRQTVGVVVLGVSAAYSAMDLFGWLRPVLLRWRARTGVEHVAGVVLGSLTFKALLLIIGILLAFWPASSHGRPD